MELTRTFNHNNNFENYAENEDFDCQHVDLEECIWYDFYLLPDLSLYKPAAEHLIKSVGISGQPKKTSSCTIHLLANLVRLYQVMPDGFIKLYRRHKHWKGSGKSKGYPNGNELRNPLNITKKILDVVDRLEATGYLEQYVGFNDRKNKKNSRVTRIKYTDKLIHVMEEYGLPDVPVGIHSFFPYVRVNAEENKPYSLPKDTKHVRRMKLMLESYNMLLRETDIRLKGYRPKTSGKLGEYRFCNPVYRVFNDYNLEAGGRFYGAWWQTCMKEGREHITINGEPTVELDYSAQHPYMLYGLKTGEHYSHFHHDQDPYILKTQQGGNYPRLLMKLFVLTALNAKDFGEAFKGLRQKLYKLAYKNFNRSIGFPWGGYEHSKYMDMADEVTYSTDLVEERDHKYKALFDDFCNKYSHIREHICSGVGKELQNWDSKIAEYVLETMTSKSIPCLCIHDSFIVQEKFTGELEVAMREAYKHLGIEACAAPICHSHHDPDSE